MPEYLAPGVYVEEVSFRSKSIEGVPTSTTGFVGMTRYGPVQYVDSGRRGPRSTEPRLTTSFTEFERVYGGLEPFTVGGVTRESYLAHAARAFFMNGGKRLYVSRVFQEHDNGDGTFDWGLARLPITFSAGADSVIWKARWPGSFGNVLVIARGVRRRNSRFAHPTFGIQAQGVARGAVVEIVEPPAKALGLTDDLNPALLAVVDVGADGKQTFHRGGGVISPSANSNICEIVLQVIVNVTPDRLDVYEELATHPAQRRWIGKILQADDPEDENSVVSVETDAPDDPAVIATLERAALLMVALQTPKQGVRLTNGNDGDLVLPTALAGDDALPDNAEAKATGLAALGEIDDIAIVAAPDGGTYDDPTLSQATADALITHAELFRYRIAVVDGPQGSSMTEIRDFRGKFDTKYAALYHPWVEILDPVERPAQGAPPRRLLLPPSGFVTGIYARTDIERGVFKAPANEVVRGLTKFEANINKARQDVLNPEGINALRFFEGRGNRVWGARCMTSDPEWRYVNVRRFFIYLEHSIDKAMQWAVFEPNNERLWANIRSTVEDFLLVQWRDGALLGATPDKAYFVRCDRTTMTENDLSNGRLICLIGVAPTRPAEFVIFRIGQWTADATN